MDTSVEIQGIMQYMECKDSELHRHIINKYNKIVLIRSGHLIYITMLKWRDKKHARLLQSRFLTANHSEYI